MTNPTVTVDRRGFVYVGNVRVARYDPVTDTLHFLDRDRWRCARRGSDEVSIPLGSLTSIRIQADVVEAAEVLDRNDNKC